MLLLEARTISAESGSGGNRSFHDTPRQIVVSRWKSWFSHSHEPTSSNCAPYRYDIATGPQVGVARQARTRPREERGNRYHRSLSSWSRCRNYRTGRRYRRIDRTSSSSTTFLPMERLGLGLHFFSLCPDMNWTCRTSSSSTTFLPMERLGLGLQQHFGVVNKSIRRIAIQPARRVRNNNANEIRNAALPPNPRSLHVLWQEYEFGIGGRKSAKWFTTEERGRVKYSYYRRKVIWDRIAAMIRAGWMSATAVDRIPEVYGANSSVTMVINAMRRHRSNDHPQHF
jgi:hypothetical protein